ncbi:MAG TPA: hypothetical protein VF461_18605 [Gemmatimonadaceae bacterium]
MRLGIIVATTTWIWVVLVDAVMQQPFHTFDALGGVAVFTAMHYLLNIVYGMILLSAVHGSERTPSLMLAVVFGVVIFEVAMAMLTIILAQYWVGKAAWAGVFGGSLIATALALFLLARTHPLGAYLHRAEEES